MIKKKLLTFQFIVLLCVCLSAQEKKDPCPSSENKKARKLYEKALDAARTNKNEARALLTEALELDPDYARANYVLADILIKSKKNSEAEPYLKRCAAICPEIDPLVFYKLGSIQFAAKNYREAQISLNKFLDSNAGKEIDRSDAREQLLASSFFVEGFAKPVPFNPKPLKSISTDADEYLHSLHNLLRHVETRKLFLPSRFEIGEFHFSNFKNIENRKVIFFNFLEFSILFLPSRFHPRRSPPATPTNTHSSMRTGM